MLEPLVVGNELFAVTSIVGLYSVRASLRICYTMSLIKRIQVLIIIVLLIVIGHNLYLNEKSSSMDRTSRLINNQRQATRRFLKTVQSESLQQADISDNVPTEYRPINPILRGLSTVSRKRYAKALDSMSSEQIDKVIREFKVKGTEFLSAESKRDFLWCDPELIGDVIVPTRSMEHRCTEMGFKEDTGKKVALASFPGSGSTWSRTLLEDATGVFTGAIYCDKKLKGDGFIGEYITTGNVIAVKSHQHLMNIPNPDRKHSVSFDAVIFIIRNVFDAIVSERKRSISKNHTGGEMREEDYGKYEMGQGVVVSF